MEGLGIKMFNKIRKVLNEQKVDPKDIDAFLKAAIDNESPTNIKFRFEKIIRTLGFDKSLLKVNTLGWAKVIAYYADAQEAKKFEQWAKSEFKSTKMIITYKDLSAGKSEAGVIFDLRNHL